MSSTTAVASAWGDFDQFGNMSGSLNSTVARTGVGAYQVTFNTSMPSDDYAINCTASIGIAAWANKNANGFVINTVNSGSGVSGDYSGASFAVFATNALPPKGGTGTDSWGDFDQNGVMSGSFNSTVVKAAVGLYDVLFNTPMPTDDYAINCTSSSGIAAWTLKTVNGFRITTIGLNGVVADYLGASFAVNATNATLPATLTQDMLVMKTGSTMTGNLTAPVVKANDHMEGVAKVLDFDKAPAGTDTTCTFESWMRRTTIDFHTAPQDSIYPTILQFGTASAWLPIDGFVASASGNQAQWALKANGANASPSDGSFGEVATTMARWVGSSNMTITWVAGLIVRGTIVIHYEGDGVYLAELDAMYQYDNPASGWGFLKGHSTLLYRSADDITKCRIVHVSPTANYPILNYNQYSE